MNTWEDVLSKEDREHLQVSGRYWKSASCHLSAVGTACIHTDIWCMYVLT